MPRVSGSRRRRLRRLSKPKCLCSRSLGVSVRDPSDFRLVFCSSGCNRPHYLHVECAAFYCSVVRSCGLCRHKFVQKSVSQQNLLQAILKRRSTTA